MTAARRPDPVDTVHTAVDRPEGRKGYSVAYVYNSGFGLNMSALLKYIRLDPKNTALAVYV